MYKVTANYKDNTTAVFERQFGCDVLDLMDYLLYAFDITSITVTMEPANG